MVKKKRATKRVAYGARPKKRVHAPVREPRTFDQTAQASIEKNREVLRELAKY